MLVANAQTGLTDTDLELIGLVKTRKIPYLTVFNKTDLESEVSVPAEAVRVSSLTGNGINDLKERLARMRYL